jgi:hypothetical protein
LTSIFSTGLLLYKTFPGTLPVPGAGFTFSIPVSEDGFVDSRADWESLFPTAQPDNQITVTQTQATSHLLKIIGFSLDLIFDCPSVV